MAEVLIVGDSLTAGHPGAGYVPLLSGMAPAHEIMADGRGGSTLSGIAVRLLSRLKRHVPDVMVIAAGMNDLLLPWMSGRGGRWQTLARRLESRGEAPMSDAASFRSRYKELIGRASQHQVKIIVATISCAGDDLGNGLNRLRARYNDAIRSLADAARVRCADVGKVFDGILAAERKSGSYLLDDYASTYLDALMTVVGSPADRVSVKRGLLLAIDGVHLNSRGARLLAETVAGALGGPPREV